MAEQSIEGAAPGLLVLGPVSALIFGFTSGLVSSSKLASKQFLAENAHRLPTTVQGWYFYQKTKNYRVLFAGLKGGFKTGARLGLWTGAFLGLEQAVDAGLRQGIVLAGPRAEDIKTTWAAGGVSGLGMAGAASWFYRLSRASSGRRYFYGLALGTIAGGMVDLRDWMKERLPKEA
ncbi:hypothetical protein Rt10032_c01g0520 [Rhodotorula toruloides]|uniref:Uncharacterized protein n=1 Tax=Rhodotorula toruloides TaxID=5286 RepID=A0A511K824_RHOTO|nr:hypothetical protein Rt10032_c01g0520 [Rhodotorula toruloides]